MLNPWNEIKLPRLNRQTFKRIVMPLFYGSHIKTDYTNPDNIIPSDFRKSYLNQIVRRSI